METADGIAQPGDDWDGATFTAPPPAPPVLAVEATAQVTRAISAVVWTILQQMYPADTVEQTKTKFGVARTRIIDAYTLQPWTP